MPNEENLHQRDGVQLNDLNAEGGLPEGQQMNDLRWLNGDYGYPFPMGPLIPLPNLTHPPLWPGLLKEGLNRPRAAAIVFKNSYSGICNIDAGKACQDGAGLFFNFWRKQGRAILERGVDYNNNEAVSRLVKDVNNIVRGLGNEWEGRRPFTHGVDTAFRNFVDYVCNGEVGEYRGAVNGVLSEWMVLAPEVFDGELIRSVTAGFNGLYKNEGARDKWFLFSRKFYPDFNGAEDIFEVHGLGNRWCERYDEGVRKYVEDILKNPRGEWNILALFFNKLLHAHMGWVQPSSIGEKRKEIIYRPLLGCLQRCAKNESHPLARTAAGIWMNMRHMAPLFDSKGEVSARDENLPDSLHMDSLMWVDECVGEVMAILGGDFKDIICDVYLLAQEVASYLTDPFAMVGMGLAKSMPSEAQLISEEVRKRIASNNIQVDGLCAVDCVVSARASLNKRFNTICENYKSDKSKLREVVLGFNNGNGGDFFLVRRFWQVNGGARVDVGEHFLDKINSYCERMAQLRNFYGYVRGMLLHYGLNEFQGEQP